MVKYATNEIANHHHPVDLTEEDLIKLRIETERRRILATLPEDNVIDLTNAGIPIKKSKKTRKTRKRNKLKAKSQER